MKRLAIFGSGSGSNAENIFWFFSKSLDIDVVLFATNNNDSVFVERSKKIGVPVYVFNKKDLDNYVNLHEILVSKNIDFIVLAGFLLKIPVKMVSFWNKKVTVTQNYETKITTYETTKAKKLHMKRRNYC